MGGLLAIVDAIVDAVPIGDSMSRDTTGSEPSPYTGGVLYGWPVVDRFVPDGTGGLDEGRYSLRLAYCVPAIEGPGLLRDRTVSEALDAAVVDIRAWVAANRASDLWEWLQVDAANYDDIRGSDYRGVRLDLSGYRELED